MDSNARTVALRTEMPNNLGPSRRLGQPRVRRLLGGHADEPRRATRPEHRRFHVTVFWTDESTHGVDTSNSDGRVRSVPLAGGTASVLLDHQDGPSQMVLWDKTLFFTTAGGFSNAGPSNNAGLYGLPVTGGVATPVVHGRPSLGALAVDGSHIAWADDLDPSNNLWGIFVAPR
jgi:hypothetical protein